MGEEEVAVVEERMIRQTGTRSRKAAGMVVGEYKWNVCGLKEVPSVCSVRSDGDGTSHRIGRSGGRADSRHLRQQKAKTAAPGRPKCRQAENQKSLPGLALVGLVWSVCLSLSVSVCLSAERASFVAAILISSSPFRFELGFGWLVLCASFVPPSIICLPACFPHSLRLQGRTSARRSFPLPLPL